MRDEGRPLRLDEGRGTREDRFAWKRDEKKLRLKDSGIEELRDSGRPAAIGRALLFRLEGLRKDDGRGMKDEG
jgi:hypothetical protein